MRCGQTDGFRRKDQLATQRVSLSLGGGQASWWRKVETEEER